MLHVPARIETILHVLEGRFGRLSAIHQIGEGQSRALVYRVVLGGQGYVLKVGSEAREYGFYEHIAPALEGHGVATPRVFWRDRTQGGFALLLEEIPMPLPRTRWIADPAILCTLHRLHALPTTLPLVDPFIPRWPTPLPSSDHKHMFSRLLEAARRLRAGQHPLSRPRHLLSGDPNPTNWGLRSNGELVLFDWGRVGYGAPAVDLAITIPGLGTADAYWQVAHAYLACNSRASQERIDCLARAIAYAKLWSVIDYLLSPSVTTERIATIISLVPEWLEHLDHAGYLSGQPSRDE